MYEMYLCVCLVYVRVHRYTCTSVFADFVWLCVQVLGGGVWIAIFLLRCSEQMVKVDSCIHRALSRSRHTKYSIHLPDPSMTVWLQCVKHSQRNRSNRLGNTDHCRDSSVTWDLQEPDFTLLTPEPPWCGHNRLSPRELRSLGGVTSSL